MTLQKKTLYDTFRKKTQTKTLIREIIEMGQLWVQNFLRMKIEIKVEFKSFTFEGKIIIVCMIDFERKSSIQKLHLKYFNDSSP